MKKVIIASMAVVTLGFLALNASPAEARGFGIHVSGPGYHVDFGDAHGRGHHRSHYGGYDGGYYAEPDYNGGHEWHDTSHYDYHPGEWVRHRGHYDYQPGHYDYHETGHLDHYHW